MWWRRSWLSLNGTMGIQGKKGALSYATQLLSTSQPIRAPRSREWMASIGQRPAYSRIAHLLCELVIRMQAVGLTQDHTCDLPITQGEFADALGISGVHVNRVLQGLRGDGL